MNLRLLIAGVSHAAIPTNTADATDAACSPPALTTIPAAEDSSTHSLPSAGERCSGADQANSPAPGRPRSARRTGKRLMAAAIIAAAAVLGPVAANAQSYPDARPVAPPQPSIFASQAASASAAAGPVIYLTDAAAQLSTVTLGTYAVKRIGFEGALLTDIAFSPGGELSITSLYGLVSTANNVLFGFAGTSVYQLFPNQSNINKRAVLLKNLSGHGVAQIFGAAYDGDFQN
jgi:hypothetical protein